jgi:light-regulated signal transduction histidine kinase (bacteriophytochrome)
VGLLSAHHYDEPRRLGRRARAVVEMLGLLVGMQLDGFQRADMASGLLALQQYQNRLLKRVATARAVPEGLIADPEALLGVCRASGAIVRVGDDMLLVGETPSKAQRGGGSVRQPRRGGAEDARRPCRRDGDL